jgi:replicative DNA helicase
MSHPELELISNILETGDFQTPKKKGVTPEMFALEAAHEGFAWLWSEYHDPQQRGEVPSVERFLRKFPDFDFSPSRNSLPALIREVRTQKSQVDLQVLLNDLQDELADGQDPTAILDGFLPKFRRMNVEAHEDEGILLSASVDLLRQEYNTQEEGGGLIGIPYPWTLLNQKTGGMMDEEFIVIYGRPGNMKTWLACAIAAQAYLDNYRVMIFSKEISRVAMLKRVSSILAGVCYDRLRRGALTPEDRDEFFDMLEILAETEEEDANPRGRTRSLLFLSDKGKRKASTVENLIAAAERFQPDLIVVDGFYLMRDGRSGQRSADWKQIGHISQDLKGMAQFCECPVVGTTQANRANAKEPSGDLDDLSFADGIGQDADIAVRAFRGPNPTGRGASIMLVFSKSRETVIPPFVINANPGSDFSVQQSTVSIKQFLAEKAKMEESEAAARGAGGPPKADPAKKKPAKKRADPFRT